jgi:hypothetical protein
VSISNNYSFNPTCDTILRMSLQMAGLLPLGRNPSAAELSHARDHFNNALKSMSGMGACLTQKERPSPLTLVAGQSTYALAADTIEVDFPMSIVEVGQTGETWIEHIVWSQYQELSNKTQQAKPTSCYVEKLATVSLIFWPVPDQAYTLSYRRQRLIRDMESGTTLDLTQRYFEAVMYMMAHKMSWVGSLTLGDKKELKRLADESLAKAMGRENEGGDTTWVLGSL